MINLGSILVSTNYFKEKNKSKILTGAVICLSFIIFISAFFSGSSTDGNKSNELINATDNNSSSSKIKVESTKDKIFKPDETFKFDDLEITIGNDISLVKVKNSYSEHKGKEVVKIPITIKNNKEESHHLNMFDYKVFGSKGTEIDDLDYLFDNSLSDAGDLRSGASYTKYMYYIYDGDGKYAIEFDDWSNKVIVEFEISKQ